jgi:PAS domain S-box-containing protein
MSEVPLLPERSWVLALSRHWRFYVVLVLGCTLPLLLFLSAGDWLLRKLIIKGLLSDSQRAAGVAGRVIEDSLADGWSAVHSLAADPVTVDLWMQRDMQRLTARLREAHYLTSQAVSWGIYDANGSLRVSYPPSGAEVNRSVASSEWFIGAMQMRTVHVSSGNGPTGFVITLAAPLACEQCGVLAATYTPLSLRNWLAPMQMGATKWISVVDHNGIVLVPPDRDPSAYLRNISAHESVRKAIAGQSGTEIVSQDGKRMLVSRHPISSLGWAVLIEIPFDEIDKALWQYERPLGLLGLLLEGIALAIGSTIAVLYRRLRESKEHVRQILTTSQDAFVAIDERGIITEWNQKAEVLFGYSAAEALGQPLHTMIVPHRYREAHLRELQRFLRTGEPMVPNKRPELITVNRSGREFPVEVSVSYVSRSGGQSFNVFLRDISDRKRAEEEIASLNRELLHEVEELEASNQQLEAFNYSVSHDVRAPLRHIVAFSQTLSEECPQDLTPTGREYLDEIKNSALRLQRLVSDLLRFSRLGPQELKLHPTDLAALIKEVVTELELDMPGRKGRIEVSPLPTVECDSGLMRQVFGNLIANAVKFTATRPDPIIEVGVNSQDETNVFFVRDNGVGFDMKYADKLFAPFQRLHSQEEFAGTGVGLAIAQRIISKHNGRIWAEAELNRGATFLFTLGTPVSRGDEVIGHSGKQEAREAVKGAI